MVICVPCMLRTRQRKTTCEQKHARCARLYNERERETEGERGWSKDQKEIKTHTHTQKTHTHTYKEMERDRKIQTERDSGRDWNRD